jgi:hypothetical protein
MQNDVIIYMIYALVYTVGAGLLAYAGTKTAEQLKQFVPTVLPFLRRFFDPDTQASHWLQKQGIDPAVADKILEAIADAVQQALEAPPREVALDAPKPPQ